MGDKPRVLVVDDVPMNLRLLSEVLRSNCRVSVAACGQDALALVRTQRPDLILLDVIMPDMDGFEVCRRLKADAATRDIPVIFITAMARQEMPAGGPAPGGAGFISKPINPAEVQAKVWSLLGRIGDECSNGR